MPFLTGRVSYLRFRIGRGAPQLFGQDHLDRLHDRRLGRQRLAAADGVEAGWTAGDHILDTDFGLEKNIVNDGLFFDMTIKTDAIPNDLLRAYYAVELKALTKNNPSGFPSAKQKREAKETARARLEEEAKDGRFIRKKSIPVMWDRRPNEVLFGATSVSQVDRFCSLFSQTFDAELHCVTAGVKAAEQAESIGGLRAIDDAAPSQFIPGTSTSDIAWISDPTNRDFLGNEFLLWLWYVTDNETDTLELSDGSELVLMMARSISLECPRGQTGHETISHTGPTRLPEARRAIRSGKLPRKAGLTMVRHDQQFEVSIGAELFAVSSGKLPQCPDDVTGAREKLEARVTHIRDLDEALSLLFRCFLERRLSTSRWREDLDNIQSWLKAVV